VRTGYALNGKKGVDDVREALRETYRAIAQVALKRQWHRVGMCMLHTRYLVAGKKKVWNYARAIGTELLFGFLDVLKKRRRCPICDWRGWEFSPVFFSENYRSASRCPVCLTCERHRLLAWLMSSGHQGQVTKYAGGKVLVVGIALEKRFLDMVFPGGYYTLDITKRLWPDIVGDLQEIPIRSREFDAILCFRVLEHVPDADGALRELQRVLKLSGTLFLSVPLYEGLKDTIEYGDDRKHGLKGPTWSYPDHRRDFSVRDLESRIQKAGMTCVPLRPDTGNSRQQEYKTAPGNDRVGKQMGLRYVDIIMCCTPTG
jgi:SAM-dependent methyltransferase